MIRTIAVLLVAVAYGAAGDFKAKPHVLGTHSFFHRTGKSCPKGTIESPFVFVTRDHRAQRACYDPRGNGEIDFLNPGEEIHLQFSIPWPAPAPPSVPVKTA